MSTTVPSYFISNFGKQQGVHYYQALIEILIRQLEGLRNTHIHIYCAPSDALDSIKFWLLSSIRGSVQMADDNQFTLTAENNTNEQRICFLPLEKNISELGLNELRKEGFQQGYETVSILSSSCPECGSRWIHMAQMVATQKKQYALGLSENGSIYLSTYSATSYAPYQLPRLNKIKSREDWRNLLEGPLGTRTNKIIHKLTGKE